MIIFQQYRDILLKNKNQTRRISLRNDLKVGSTHAVVPKMYRHAVWYKYDNEDLKVWHEIHSSLLLPPPYWGHEGWAELRVRILDKHRERLQSISREDALSEGILENQHGAYYASTLPTKWSDNPVDAYRNLWNSINQRNGQRWEDNPTVTVVKFEVVKP